MEQEEIIRRIKAFAVTRNHLKLQSDFIESVARIVEFKANNGLLSHGEVHVTARDIVRETNMPGRLPAVMAAMGRIEKDSGLTCLIKGGNSDLTLVFPMDEAPLSAASVAAISTQQLHHAIYHSSSVDAPGKRIRPGTRTLLLGTFIAENPGEPPFFYAQTDAAGSFISPFYPALNLVAPGAFPKGIPANMIERNLFEIFGIGCADIFDQVSLEQLDVTQLLGRSFLDPTAFDDDALNRLDSILAWLLSPEGQSIKSIIGTWGKGTMFKQNLRAKLIQFEKTLREQRADVDIQLYAMPNFYRTAHDPKNFLKELQKITTLTVWGQPVEPIKKPERKGHEPNPEAASESANPIRVKLGATYRALGFINIPSAQGHRFPAHGEHFEYTVKEQQGAGLVDVMAFHGKVNRTANPNHSPRLMLTTKFAHVVQDRMDIGFLDVIPHQSSSGFSIEIILSK